MSMQWEEGISGSRWVHILRCQQASVYSQGSPEVGGPPSLLTICTHPPPGLHGRSGHQGSQPAVAAQPDWPGGPGTCALQWHHHGCVHAWLPLASCAHVPAAQVLVPCLLQVCVSGLSCLTQRTFAMARPTPAMRSVSPLPGRPTRMTSSRAWTWGEAPATATASAAAAAGVTGLGSHAWHMRLTNLPIGPAHPNCTPAMTLRLASSDRS